MSAAQGATERPAPERGPRGAGGTVSILAPRAGFLLLAGLVREGGAGGVGRRRVGLGPALPLALLPYTVVSLCDALGWRVVLRAFGVAQPFARLWLERLAGEAVNSVAPTGMGGEPVKILLLRADGVRGSAAAAAVVTSRTGLILAQSLLVVFGIVALLVRLGRHVAAPIALAGLLGLTALFGLLLVRVQKGGVARMVARGLAGLLRTSSHTAGRAPGDGLRDAPAHAARRRGLAHARVAGLGRRGLGRAAASRHVDLADGRPHRRGARAADPCDQHPRPGRGRYAGGRRRRAVQLAGDPAGHRARPVARAPRPRGAVRRGGAALPRRPQPAPKMTPAPPLRASRRRVGQRRRSATTPKWSLANTSPTGVSNTRRADSTRPRPRASGAPTRT